MPKRLERILLKVDTDLDKDTLKNIVYTAVQEAFSKYGSNNIIHFLDLASDFEDDIEIAGIG